MSGPRTSTSGRSPVLRRDELRALVVAAARTLFRERGVRGTRMEDVAAAAGISRRDIYRAFAGRDEIVEEAVVARMRENALTLPSGLDRYASFPEALVELTVATVEAGRADEEQRSLFAALGSARCTR